MSLDWNLFRILNSLAGRSPVLDALIRLLMNDYLITTALVLLPFVLWFSGSSQEERERNQLALPSAIAAMFAGNLFIKLLNLLFYRPRPFAAHAIHLLFYRPSDSSFPSNATSVGFSMATAVWLFNRKAGWAMYILALLFGLSRVVGGVHYPTDVLAGAVIGIAAGYLVVRRLPALQRLWRAVIRFMRRWALA
jgi:undecaprenyl-diphosphatase